jgi:poly-beta-1,6-N-acetyl-D-glucosamine synthase
VLLSLPPYVLITPARNEAAFIELTIRSVVAQTIKPVRWIIVSDGSTDGTDDIVKRYQADHPWIELLRMPERQERHFAGKVHAFSAGYRVVSDLTYEFIGSLDADISFDPEYFSFLLTRLVQDSELGLVGTPFKEASSDMTYDYRFVSIEHVSGACQLFRRQCFEQVGGYIPVKGGGIDHIAVIMARMKGWKTRTFTEKACWHHRQIGTAQRYPFVASFETGARDYALGGHPLWECFRTIYQMSKRPFVISGLLLGAGYLWALISRYDRTVTPELMAFRRKEQMQRLKRFLSGGWLSQRSSSAT